MTQSLLHVVGALLITQENKFLLCHRSPTRLLYPLVWELPGGKVAHDETPAAALIRELQEELGIETSPLPATPTFSATTNEAFASVWRIQEWNGSIENRRPDEHTDLQWVTKAEAQNMTLGPLCTHLLQQIP
jgi:8-oxo-dGTP diphosphatase